MPTARSAERGALLPALGLGCVTFGRELGEDESFRILDHALEQGLSLFDTAESYGTSEEIIGRWLASRDFPKEVTICTKVSFDNSPEHIACARPWQHRTTGHCGDRPLPASRMGRTCADW